MTSTAVRDSGEVIADRAAYALSLYPVHVRLRDGSAITIRPIGPQDARREQEFVRALSPQSRYFRFMSALRELPAEVLHRFTHPDFEREVALVALTCSASEPQQIAVARCVTDADPHSAEFAIVVADEWQSRGVGSRLLCELTRAARAAGIKRVWGDVLAGNQRMLALAGALGFDIVSVPEDALLRRVVKNIDSKASAA